MNNPQHPRDSLYSTDSTTTYASTLSSHRSALGLTDSPLPPDKKTMAVLEAVRDGGGDYRRQAILRQSRSKVDLKSGGGVVTQRVQSMEDLKGGSGDQNKRVKEGSGKEKAVTQRTSSSQLKARSSSSQLKPILENPSQPQQAQPVSRKSQIPEISSDPPPTTRPDRNQIAIPVRRIHPTQSTLHPPPPGPRPPGSPAPTDMADDWDAELKRNAAHSDIRIRPLTAGTTVVTRQPSRDNMAESRGRDEWERAAMMIDKRETGRDDEERNRRDPTREIGELCLPVDLSSFFFSTS